jgi:PKD repeat protein
MDLDSVLHDHHRRARQRVRNIAVSIVTMLLATVVTVSTGPAKVEAGIFNPIPMDSSEQINDLFTDADALFAFVTADTKGGTICIVSADVLTPDGASCKHPAWGTPNFIVGIGSVIQPIQPPPLKPGNWKLLTENTDGTGTGLSDVFTVQPCPTCSRAIADAALAPWKAMAADRRVGANLYCSIQELRDKVEAARDEALGAEKLEWKDTGVALVTIGYSPLGGFAFEIADPLVVLQQKALEILKDLSCAVSNMYGNIAADPPRPDYQTVPPTVVGTVSPMPAPEELALGEAMAAQVAHGSASLRAYERYLGATAAGDLAGIIRQAQAASDESLAFIDAIVASANALDAFATYADTEPALAGPLFPDQATLDELAGGYTRARTTGFTATEIDQLHALGLSDLQIAGLRENLMLDLTGVTPAATIGDAARQLAIDLRASVPAIDGFAREAAAVAARNQLDVVNLAPTALITASPDAGEQPLFTFLNGVASTDPDGFIVSHAWDFGDGTTAIGSFVSHTFIAAGTYTVTLTVTDDGGATAQATQIVTVTASTVPPDLVPPVARRVSPGASYSYVASGSTAAASKLLTFTLDFGDGSAPVVLNSTDSVSVDHSYVSTGSFVLATSVTNALGLTSTAVTDVTVAAPVADAGPDLEGVEGTPLTFSGPSASQSDVNTTVTWDFGDATGSSEVSPQHTYRDNGVYVVTRTATDSVSLESVTDTATVTIANAPPVVNGMAYTATPTPSEAASFRAFATDPGVDDSLVANWTFGDGSTASGLAVDHQFALDGTYTVNVVVSDGQGGEASTSRIVTVGPPSGARDSKGREHWLAFQTNYTNALPELTLSIAAESATSGEVEIPAIGYRVPFSVTPGIVTTVDIPATAMPLAIADTQALGLHVVAANEVSVYGLNRIQFTTDAFLGLPRDVLGTSHVVASFSGALPSEITIAAPYNHTTVAITPVGSLTLGPDTPTSFVLDAGDVVQLQGFDLTGSTVTSSRPVAVFGGNQCGNVPLNMTFCDHLTEQMPSTDLLGSRFITVPLATRLNGDTVRVVASQASTVVTINGADVATIGTGEYYETILAAPSLITTSAPAVVAQYSNGTSYDGVTSDPFEMLVPPTEQYLPSYTVTTPATGFSTNFVNLVAPTASTSTVLVDGVAVDTTLWVPVAGSAFSGAQVPVSLGSHTIAADTPVGVFVYGFDAFDSYGYPGGFQLARVGAVASVTLAPPNQSLAVNTNACVVATVVDAGGSPLADVRVDFTVAGVHPSTGFAFTGPNGTAQQCWIGTTPGADTVTASVGAFTDIAIVTWTSGVVVNRPPVADPKFVITVEDTAVPVLLSGSDPDGDPITFAVLTTPAHGVLSGSGALLTYTPAANYFGADSFTYRVSDGALDSAVATVDITITAANDAPIADDKLVNTPEDTAVDITLTGSDVEGSALSFVVLGPLAHGTLTGTGATRTYTPDPNFQGADSFTYRVNDGTANSNVATVQIEVTSVNDAPVVVNRLATTPQDTPVDITLSGVDVDGDTLTFAVITGPSHGILTGSGSTLTYTPAPGYFGPDSFTYLANDGTVDSNVGNGLITVERVNHAPVASAQSVSTGEDTPVSITLVGTDADNDPLTFAVVGPPLHGTLSGSGAQLTYTPTLNFNGTDSFTYTVGDGTATSAPAIVSITVNPVNDPPSVAIVAGTPRVEGSTIALTATANDVDGDVLVLTWSVTSAVLDAGGTCTLGAATGSSSSLTCTDDGAVTVEVAAGDGTTSVATSVGMTVLNSAPTVVIRPISTPGIAPAVVSITADVADAGSNDTQTCTIAFGDGSSQSVPVAGSVCSATATVIAPGSYTASVTAIDDDGGQSVTTSDYAVQSPPVVAACATALGDGYWTSRAGTWKLELDDLKMPFDAVADTLEITWPGSRQREYQVATIDIVGSTATITSKPAKDGSRVTAVVIDNGRKGDRFSVVIAAGNGSVVASTGGLQTVTKDGFTVGPRTVSPGQSCIVGRPRS